MWRRAVSNVPALRSLSTSDQALRGHSIPGALPSVQSLVQCAENARSAHSRLHLDRTKAVPIENSIRGRDAVTLGRVTPRRQGWMDRLRPSDQFDDLCRHPS